jgi:hypothetical protein
MVAGTATYLAGRKELPNVFVVGDKQISLPFSGEGAARVISEPISTQSMGNSRFILLDLGPIPPRPSHTDRAQASDPRQISLYLRDVSLLTEEEYAAIAPPKCLKSFPADLGQKQLEFSGCEENGSVANHAWFRLMRPESSGPLIVRGRLLQIERNTTSVTTLRVKWDGAEVGQWEIETSEFDFSVPLPDGHGPGRLELEFTRNHSSHTAIAQLTFVGFDR